jgi:hypothetical protein
MGLLETGQMELFGDLPEPGGDQTAARIAEYSARGGEDTLLCTEPVRKLSAQG